jgi:hypothetical protein
MKRARINPPAETYGPDLAAEIVAMVNEEANIRLDYSPSSLTLVDRLIDGMARDRLTPRAVEKLLLGLGAYTGEVAVRRTRGCWIEFDTEQRGIFGQPFGIQTPDGRLWNPLGKVVERYEAGVRTSLTHFYRTIANRAQA